jgi:DNA (cytosine-5)-methyltransferase 1
LFWEFARVIEELGARQPPALLIENVPSLASSHGGQDLRAVVERLNQLGYWCDLLVVDARHFVPQSRARLFIVGSRSPLASPGDWSPSPLRPAWVQRFVAACPELRLTALTLTLPPPSMRTLADIVERLPADDARWWPAPRVVRFRAELSPLQAARLARMADAACLTWASAYRRTRGGRPAWEIRADALSGCLRTARGGSSKQALVEAGHGAARVRWMTAREYARLQGADDYDVSGVPENRALFGFGDAVCVPVVAWLARNYLAPLLAGTLTAPTLATASADD